MLNGQAMEKVTQRGGVDYQIGDAAAFTRDQLESWEPQKKRKINDDNNNNKREMKKNDPVMN